MVGKIKWINNKKGYGFITNKNGQNVFFHYSGINIRKIQELNTDDEVNFDIEINERGIERAVNMQLIEKN